MSEQDAIVHIAEVWAARNAGADLLNATRRARFDNARLVIFEADLPVDHVRKSATSNVTPMKRKKP